MNQLQFHQAVRAIANGLYFSTYIEVSEHPHQPLVFEYRAYIVDRGWVDGPTGESVLLRLVTPDQSLDTLDALPAEAVPA